MKFFKTKEKNYYIKKYFLGIKYSSVLNIRKILCSANMTVEHGVNPMAAFSLHQKTFQNYKNKYYGKDVVLLATGPSMKHYKPIDNAIHVGVNKAFTNKNVKCDYIFIQDYYGSSDYMEELCNAGADVFMGLLSHYWPKSIIPESIALKYGAKRFYTYHPDERAEPVYDISSMAFWDSYSIVFPAMQFILYTNPKRIYLVGCDTNHSGYHSDSDGKNKLMLDNVKAGWAKLKEFAAIYYPETEIISVNPVGLKGMFTDEYQDNESIVD